MLKRSNLGFKHTQPLHSPPNPHLSLYPQSPSSDPPAYLLKDRPFDSPSITPLRKISIYRESAEGSSPLDGQEEATPKLINLKRIAEGSPVGDLEVGIQEESSRCGFRESKHSRFRREGCLEDPERKEASFEREEGEESESLGSKEGSESHLRGLCRMVDEEFTNTAEFGPGFIEESEEKDVSHRFEEEKENPIDERDQTLLQKVENRYIKAPIDSKEPDPLLTKFKQEKELDKLKNQSNKILSPQNEKFPAQAVDYSSKDINQRQENSSHQNNIKEESKTPNSNIDNSDNKEKLSELRELENTDILHRKYSSEEKTDLEKAGRIAKQDLETHEGPNKNNSFGESTDREIKIHNKEIPSSFNGSGNPSIFDENKEEDFYCKAPEKHKTDSKTSFENIPNNPQEETKEQNNENENDEEESFHDPTLVSKKISTF